MRNLSKDVPTSILDIPDDCLCYIFHQLENSSDRESFGLTCHRLLQIQNSKRRSLQFYCSLTLLHPVTLSTVDLSINSFHLNRLLTRFQQLSSLFLSGCARLSDVGLTPLQFFGSNLKTLNLDCCFGITDEGLSSVAVGCSSLTSISLHRCNVTDIGLETLAKSCLHLQDVNLSYCRLLSDHGIRSLTKECRQLRSVTISHCVDITGIGFKGCSQTLAHVEAESCKLDLDGIRGLVSGGGLEYLNVSCLSWSIHGDGLVGLGMGFATRLRVLNLRLCRSASNEAVVSIAKGCPSLQEWGLVLCHEITLPGWEAIGSNCHSLEIIHVNRCQKFCDGGLRALQNGCSRLLQLYMHHCPRITHLALESFKRLRGDVDIRGDEVMLIRPRRAFH